MDSQEEDNYLGMYEFCLVIIILLSLATTSVSSFDMFHSLLGLCKAGVMVATVDRRPPGHGRCRPNELP